MHSHSTYSVTPPSPSPMLLALAAARRSISKGQSPFAAIIIRTGTPLLAIRPAVIADTHNHVRLNTDPTAHAEVMAIRDACRALGTIDLSGHEMYTTCEPCPMCASAIHWARLDAVHYGATIADAAKAGFNELHMPITTLYKDGGSRVRIIPNVLQQECAALFDEWLNAGGNPY